MRKEGGEEIDSPSARTQGELSGDMSVGRLISHQRAFHRKMNHTQKRMLGPLRGSWLY